MASCRVMESSKLRKENLCHRFLQRTACGSQHSHPSSIQAMLSVGPAASALAKPNFQQPRQPKPRRAAILSVRAAAGTMEPTINFDRVTDAILVGSCLRNAADAQKAAEAGTSIVFSLQDDTDLANQKLDAAAVAADCKAAGVKHVRFPTSDEDEQLLRQRLPAAVAAFAREIAAAHGGSAYIHCNGGRGRAPTVVVAYLYWLCGQALSEAAATMTSGRGSQPKMAIIQGATADLLGSTDTAPVARECLSSEEQAAVKAQLQALA